MFYVQDPCEERWLVVLHEKTIGVNVEDDDSTVDTYVSPSKNNENQLTSHEGSLWL